jgi:hypothetical protein
MTNELLPEQEAFIKAYSHGVAKVSEETLREYFELDNYGQSVYDANLDSPEHITDCWILFYCGVKFGIGLN